MADKVTSGSVDDQSGELKHTFIKEEHEISVLIAIFSVVSVTIGAGMVSVPKSSYESGIPWAIGYNVLNYVCCIYSIHLYYECARVTGLWSIPHLGYECFGNCSLYVVNVITFIGFGLLPIAYYIIFANLLKSLFNEIHYVKNNNFFLGSQWFNVLVLAVLVFPLIIKKKIQELKIAGILLFSGVIIFIILMLVLKILDESSLDFHANEPNDFYKFEVDKDFLSSLSTAFVAYGFQSAFFPIYNSLKEKTYKNAMTFSILGIGFCFVIYISIMFISLYSFGLHIKGDVLQNVEDVPLWESYVLRVIFLLVISTHTPFIFFIGKEAVLALLALFYTRNQKDDVDQAALLDTSEQKPLIVNNPNQSMNVRRSSIRHLENSRKLISSSVDFNISMALPFYHKSMRTLIVSSNDKLDDAKPAHDILPATWYYITTFVLYSLVVGAACLIKDVEIVIKFIGSLANATLNFTLPGLYYFIIMRKYDALEGQNWKAYLALTLALYGFSMGVFCTGVNVWTTISPLEEPDSNDDKLSGFMY